MIEIDRARFHQLKVEIGTRPARAQCMREAMIAAIEQAESVSDLKCILLEIVKQIRFDR